MKIAIAQQNYHIGNFEYNTNKIIQAIQEAKNDGASLIVFPELAICGYPPRDLLYFDDFINKCNQSIDQIKSYTSDIGVLIGAPAKNPVLEGKQLHNSAYYIYQGEIKNVIHKTLLPNYDVFDEYRYFEPAKTHEIIEHLGKKIAITICEDIWDIEEDPMYNFEPLEKLTVFQPDFVVNLSASPYNYNHANNRKVVLKRNSIKYNLPIIYCNCTGSQTEIVFDGGSLVFDALGNQLLELPYFEEQVKRIEIDENNHINLPIQINSKEIPNQLQYPNQLIPDYNIDSIYNALVFSIREYFSKMGFQKAIITSSGGIDSAVTLVLACHALGSENVHALLLPSQYSTQHSVTDAIQLSENLNNPYDIIAIEDIYNGVLSKLEPLFKDKPMDVTEENIQSRVRGILAMAYSNKFNHILLNTSNKSELATGYGTLYGDMAGGLGILGDLYKLQVYALARYINRSEEIIPNNIIDKAPSAELRPDQKDSDSLPDYQLLDNILYQYIDRFKSAEAIRDLGYDDAMVKKIINMVNKTEFKRNQFCPIIRISSKSFGIGRRIPIVARYVI